MARRLGTVRYHKNRLPLLIDLRKQRQQAVGCLGIQSSCRFIRKDQLRLCDDCPRHRRTLFLSTGHLIRILLQNIHNAKFLRNWIKPLIHLLIRHI